MIFMSFKIKIIAQTFNKIRFIWFYSKFCEGWGAAKLGAYQSLQRGVGVKNCPKKPT